MRTKNKTRLFLAAATALSVVCGIVSTSVAQEDFAALVKRTQAEKPKFAERHQKLLAERYDLADRPAKGVTMSRGKPVQEGVRVRLPQGMTWEKLAGNDAGRDQEQESLAGGLLSLAAPASRSGRDGVPQAADRRGQEAERARSDALRSRLRFAAAFAAGVPRADLSDHAARSGRRVEGAARDAGELLRPVQGRLEPEAVGRPATVGHALSPAAVQFHR